MKRVNKMINHIKLSGYGKALPKETMLFKKQTRYRVSGQETQLTLAIEAVDNALEKADMHIDNIDCIVSASAVGIQPIPCTAALIHEKIAPQTSIPAIDINTTCTSFISAVDIFSYLIEAGRYKNVLIISSDTASLGLNENEKESFELFSDGAAAFILSKTDENKGIVASDQKTWSEGAHATEIRGGLSGYHPNLYSEETKEEYMFTMHGREILSLTAKKLPEFYSEFMSANKLEIEKISRVVPHQASRAMPFMMQKLGIPKGKFIDKLAEYGNMVSASIPFVLCEALEKGEVLPGDRIMLIGTAAGMTINLLAWDM